MILVKLGNRIVFKSRSASGDRIASAIVKLYEAKRMPAKVKIVNPNK